MPGNNYMRFDEISKVGRINKPLRMGLLTRVRDDKNEVAFLFKLNKKTIEAKSPKTNGCAENNTALLKEGCFYTIKGNILSEGKNSKFHKGSNSTCRYVLKFFEIEVVQEIKCKGFVSSKNRTGPFCEMNRQIRSNKSFTLDANDVEILSGDVRRYMGCQVCFSGLSTSTSSGKFYCKICNKNIQNRQVCIVIRDLRLKDKQDNILESSLCFQRQCENLFEKDELDRISKSQSDLDACNALLAIIGTTVSVTIKHQPANSSQNAKTVINKLEVCALRRQNDTSVSNTASCSTNPIPQNGGNNSTSFCLCAEDDDDDGNDTEPLLIPRKQNVKPGTSSITINLRALNFDPETDYQLTATSEGHIGLALIVNMYFPEDKKPRKGSENDVRRLKELFPKLGVRIFQDEAILDPYRENFYEVITAFKRELVEKNYSSLFFVLMSHGRLYTLRLGDRSAVNIYKDILPLFLENQFPEFVGKPKIFLFNSCQNFGDGPVDPSEWKIPPHEVLMDVLECYPCSPGYKAKRNRDQGSYFIQNFADVFEEYFETMHIRQMMDLVQERMSTLWFKDATNVPVYKPMLFGKQFHFLPRNAP